jgi:phosphonate transport system permease protein
MNEREEKVRDLWKNRPRRPFLRWSLFLLFGLGFTSWFSGEIDVAGLFSSQRIDNLGRFLTEEVVPPSVQEGGSFWEWAGNLFSEKGGDALWVTFHMSIISILFAGVVGFFLAFPAARNFMQPEPFLPGQKKSGIIRKSIIQATRFIQLFMRAIPEYVWAYLFLAMLGPSAWPAILALAIHNGGILGKLNSEVIENLDPAALRSLRMLGAKRFPIAGLGIFPTALPRFLLYFFYRFETCVREATVLGMLGIVSLGYWIGEARNAHYFDEMIFFVVLGSGIVIFADLISALARWMVRRAV